MIELQLESQTQANIHLEHIKYNIRHLREHLPAGVLFMAAVKANAYGHGDIQVAQAAVQAGADAFAVGMLSEALRLRRAGIKAPILVLTPISPQEVQLALEHDISLSVFQAAWLTEMFRYKNSCKPLRIHLKMDTGMGRLGIREKEEFETMLPLLKTGDLLVEGVYTHFATANQADSTYYDQQVARFLEMRQWLVDSGFQGFLSHCANSAAALAYPDLSLDMVRVGAAIYGINTCDDEVQQRLPIKLKPTLSLQSEIVHVKRLNKGSYLGYDQSYQTTEDEWIATVAVGYADGYFRGFQGFYTLVEGQVAPIVGKICMDHLMIRLPDYYPTGTKVTLIGREGQQEITLDDLARHIGSIPQQVLSLLTERVPRIYTDYAS